ncbi:MAG: metallophosphoesterase [Lachnospiraceae bacterium]|nr:metallophosphoesterase [Lachnospiraceae bacterium]
MYIVQIADLHIGSETKCLEKENIILSRGIEQIKQNIPKDQKVLICACGDIIDSKNSSKWKKGTAKERYDEAAELFRLASNELKDDYEVKFQFCLGNHDVTHISEFLNFAQEFDLEATKEKIEDGYYMEWDGIYYIFLNSCNGGQYEYGRIDYAKMEQLLKGIPINEPKIIVLHHTIISMYEKDQSSIRDSAHLLNLIEKYNVFGVLHGHIHGRERFLIGHKKCRMIGAGALFSRNYPNVNSQFNIIELEQSILRDISTFVYMADDRISGESWRKINSEKENDENYFCGDSFQDIYQNLLSRLASRPTINNVVLQLNSSYDEFKNDLETFLQDEKLVIGKRRFSYFDLAEQWENIKVPEHLYFNHGMYFKVRDEENDGAEVHGIQFVIRQLKSKPTSNKAVLTTYGMDTVTKMLKGEEYLPSLLSIQFSKSSDGDTIYVHMYLRALEVGRFLKINICEIEWLLEQLRQENVLFKRVDIAISAFRVQKREKFNCFIKAEIDNMDDIDLASYVNAGDVSMICQMLEEKIDASETITNVKGLEALCKAMKKSNERPNLYQYNLTAIKKLDSVLDVYAKLDAIHKRGSINTEEEKSNEIEIRAGINGVIAELKKVGD